MDQERHTKRSPKNVIARKVIIGIPLLAALGFLLFVAPYWSDGGLMYRSIKWAGVVFMAICIIGRSWASLYIGGRKNLEVIDIGPYSMTRNPLYFFSVVGAVGAGTQSGSLCIGLLAGIFTWLIFFRISLGEEAYLLSTHGESYRHYMARVPRFLPKFNAITSPDTLVIRPRAVFSTFFDSLFFLISIPLAELFAHMHSWGVLPVYFIIP